ncbi:TetR/AcrR family transcriptional regulator [Spongiibacter taiwanensis]|uniref:TetR/AcrR family transcriptional regulator n=1 Tax=Spongiibacter taiwanensis TaxID=1748242 RepID=UPI002034E23C|nr:TetR/AcrR family transcriptional regulator [Spongiibacter taiwanensis]USA42002.1 TetR/AcrR family transcriptional regulator [Spongiibacter taiwanensis]
MKAEKGKVGATPRMSKDQRVANILTVAKRHFGKVGYENFSPVEVAQECGVSEATIYRYFASKQDLLERVAEFWVEELLLGAPNFKKHDNIYDRLREVIWYSLWVVHSEPELSKYIWMAIRSQPDFRSSRIYSLNRRFTAYTTNVIADAMAQGVFRADISARTVRNIIFGTIEHEVWSFVQGDGDFSLEASVETITGFVFRGLAVEAPVNVETFHRALARIQSGLQKIDGAVKQLTD